MGAPKFCGQRGHTPNVPNDQLPIDPGRANPSNRPALPLVRPHTRDSVLVHREQLRFLRGCAPSATGTTDAPGISVLEGVERGAVQPPGST